MSQGANGQIRLNQGGVGQGISHSSLGKREANPKPLSILDVLFQDNSDLSLLLGNNGALGAENVDTLPQKSGTRDKDTLDKKDNLLGKLSLFIKEYSQVLLIQYGLY